MSPSTLSNLIESLINGDISAADHDQLQAHLKASAHARAVFRERIDLEAGLRTWSAESADQVVARQSVAAFRDTGMPTSQRRITARGSRLLIAAIVVCAATFIARVGSSWLLPNGFETSEIANENSVQESVLVPSQPHFVGVIRKQQDCVWKTAVLTSHDHFPTGRLSLTAGLAELSFDSGTDVILEAPCEFEVTSSDSARLLSGKVSVTVTEVSNGFTLRTPEAEILDLGTEYAVALDEESTEVHVFDGSVLWIPDVQGVEIEDRIEAGEARQYTRSDPVNPKRIPFGQRQFVRQIEADIRQQAGDALLGYDGFENLAGHLRRGRSGFGWSGGWQSSRRGRGQVAEIIDAPDDAVFGQNRSARRLLQLADGDDIRRVMEHPLTFTPGDTYFVSLLAERRSTTTREEQSLRISLEPESIGRGRRQPGISFGVTTEGFPFINSGSNIIKTASRMPDSQTCLFVLKLAVTDNDSTAQLRVFQREEPIDASAPSVWTVNALSQNLATAGQVRLTAGEHACWWIDELRIGKQWQSVTRFSDSE